MSQIIRHGWETKGRGRKNMCRTRQKGHKLDRLVEPTNGHSDDARCERPFPSWGQGATVQKTRDGVHPYPAQRRHGRRAVRGAWRPRAGWPQGAPRSLRARTAGAAPPRRPRVPPRSPARPRGGPRPGAHGHRDQRRGRDRPDQPRDAAHVAQAEGVVAEQVQCYPPRTWRPSGSARAGPRRRRGSS